MSHNLTYANLNLRTLPKTSAMKSPTRGVYLMTLKWLDGWFVPYVGAATRTIGERMDEHIQEPPSKLLKQLRGIFFLSFFTNRILTMCVPAASARQREYNTRREEFTALFEHSVLFDCGPDATKGEIFATEQAFFALFGVTTSRPSDKMTGGNINGADWLNMHSNLNARSLMAVMIYINRMIENDVFSYHQDYMSTDDRHAWLARAIEKFKLNTSARSLDFCTQGLKRVWISTLLHSKKAIPLLKDSAAKKTFATETFMGKAANLKREEIQSRGKRTWVVSFGMVQGLMVL